VLDSSNRQYPTGVSLSTAGAYGVCVTLAVLVLSMPVVNVIVFVLEL
jgi:hypothetical protein